MIKYYTPKKGIASVEIRATGEETHIMPLLSTGECGDREIIPNDSRASWYIGNRYFNSEQGSEAYTQYSAGGVVSIVKHVMVAECSVLFAVSSTGKSAMLVNTQAIDEKSTPAWYSPVFGAAA